VGKLETKSELRGILNRSIGGTNCHCIMFAKALEDFVFGQNILSSLCLGCKAGMNSVETMTAKTSQLLGIHHA